MEDFIQRQSRVIFARDVAKPLSSFNRAVLDAPTAATKNAEAMIWLGGDEIRFGRVWNGFDYELQVWGQTASFSAVDI
jgi:hypothetical protein